MESPLKPTSLPKDTPFREWFIRTFAPKFQAASPGDQRFDVVDMREAFNAGIRHEHIRMTELLNETEQSGDEPPGSAIKFGCVSLSAQAMYAIVHGPSGNYSAINPAEADGWDRLARLVETQTRKMIEARTATEPLNCLGSSAANAPSTIPGTTVHGTAYSHCPRCGKNLMLVSTELPGRVGPLTSWRCPENCEAHFVYARRPTIQAKCLAPVTKRRAMIEAALDAFLAVDDDQPEAAALAMEEALEAAFRIGAIKWSRDV